MLGAVVLVPLGREYAALRTAGLARTSAGGTVALLLPALAVGLALALPFAERPHVQWTVTVIVTLVVYSTATRAILARASSAGTAPSRKT
jgi:hypothetical protein